MKIELSSGQYFFHKKTAEISQFSTPPPQFSAGAEQADFFQNTCF